MTETDYSIYLSHTNAIERMEKFNQRAVKAKTHKTMHKNFRIADALYAEYRELIEDEPNYVTFTLNHLEGIFDD
jgi:hypothetical protein